MKLCLFFSVIVNPLYKGPYEGYFIVCLGCHNLHLHYKRLSNLPFLVSREYKNILFYLKCEIKNKQPFENMWSNYIKEFLLLIHCFFQNTEIKLRKICFPNPPPPQERKKHIKIKMTNVYYAVVNSTSCNPIVTSDFS